MSRTITAQHLPSFIQNVDQFETLARVGYIAKGVVYTVIGILATMAAFGAGGQTAGKKGAAQEILQQPFGQVLLFIVAVGILGYVAFRASAALTGTSESGDDKKKEVAKRIGYAASALSYLAFSIYCFTMIFGNSGGSGSGGSTRKSIIATVLDWPGGAVLIGIVALALLAKGLYQFYKGYKNKFKEDVRTEAANPKIKQMYDIAGKIGYIARGVVITLLGYFLMKAAWGSNASEVKGTEGILDFLMNTGGPILMGLIAIGLIGYGVFMFVKARYGKLKTNFA